MSLRLTTTSPRISSFSPTSLPFDYSSNDITPELYSLTEATEGDLLTVFIMSFVMAICMNNKFSEVLLSAC
jgi:hypothetical protein